MQGPSATRWTGTSARSNASAGPDAPTRAGASTEPDASTRSANPTGTNTPPGQAPQSMQQPPRPEVIDTSFKQEFTGGRSFVLT
jgi:hypothetical protein